MKNSILFILIAVLFAACSNHKDEVEQNPNIDELIFGIVDEEGNFVPVVKEGVSLVPVYMIKVDANGHAHVFQTMADGNCGNIVDSEQDTVKDMTIFVYPISGKAEIIR